MEKITVSVKQQNKIQKGKSQKKEKVILTYHPFVEGSPEKYTYLDNGEEVEFTDKTYNIFKVSQSKSIAKKTLVEKVNLDFVPSKEEIPYQESYFSYNGEKFVDPVRFDEETNSYIGTITKSIITNKEIKLFE